MEHEVVDKSGSWYSYGDLRLGQGKENSREFLKENPDVLAEVDNRVREALGLIKSEGEEDEAAEASTQETSAAADD